MSGDNPLNSAFPVPLGYTTHGMTLRDYFAAIDMPGDFITFRTMKAASEFVGLPVPSTDADYVTFYLTINAKMRYMRADAMLAERAKGGK